MATMVREGIVHDVEKVGCYALICDETRDIKKVERLACVLRFVNMDSCETTEALLLKGWMLRVSLIAVVSRFLIRELNKII